MRIFGFLKKKDPKEEFRKELNELTFTDKAVNLKEKFPKYDFTIIQEVIREEAGKNNIEGIFIGKQGWFLPNHGEKLENAFQTLNKGPIDLNIYAKNWGLNNKRVFIALENEAAKRKLQEPFFVRKDNLLFLRSYLEQKIIEALAILDLDIANDVESLFEQIQIPSDHLSLVQKELQNFLSSGKLDFTLGNDNIIYHKSILAEKIVEFIESQWLNKVKVIEYSLIGEVFGLPTEKIGEILQKLIDKKELENVTLYPLDEQIKPRITE